MELRLLRCCVLVLPVLMGTWCNGADKRPVEEVVCPAAPSTLVIDGNQTDSAWQSASASAALRPIGLEIDESTPARMRARFLCDDVALYIAINADSAPGVVPSGRRKNAKHDGRIFYDESVEVFLQPQPTSSDYVQLVLNCDGVAFDSKREARPAKGATTGREWNPEWRRATTKREGGWSAEIAIPYASLDVDAPRQGFVWRIKIGHNAPGQPHEMWPRNDTTSFHNPNCWAYLQFHSANLLANGSFETIDENGRPQGWRYLYHKTEGKGEISLTETDAPEGQRSIRYEKYKAFKWFPQLWTDPVPIQPHSTYEFSALVDSPKAFVVRHGFFSAEGRRTAKFSRTEPPTKGFERRSISFRIEDEEPQVALGLQYSRVAGVMRIDDARLVRLNDAEYRKRPIPNPHRYHHLERLAERRPFKPTVDIGAHQDERVIFRDSATGAPIWRITDTPSGATRHYYMEACPWNCAGSRFLLKRGGLVEFSAAGLEGKTLNDWGGWFAWDREDPDVFYFCRTNKPTSQCFSYSFKTGKETLLRTFEGSVAAWVISWDNRYLLCKQHLADKPLEERTKIILVDLRGNDDIVLDPKGHIHQLWFTKLRDYSVEFEYEHHGGYEQGDYKEGNFMMTLDGSIRLIYGGEGMWAGHRAHSPSGEWMCPGGTLQIVSKLTGEKRILGNIGGNHQSWETDDSWLAASSGIHLIRFAADNRGFIHRIGSHNSRIGHSTYWSEAHPAMSPDGTKLGYASSMLGDIDFHFIVMMPPGRPEGLSAVTANGGTIISWRPPKHAKEIGGYLVYVAETSGGPYRQLTSDPVEAVTTSVPIPADGKARYYVVTSLERTGLESLASNEVCSAPSWSGPVALTCEAEFAPVTAPPATEAFDAAASGMHVLNLGHGRPAKRVVLPFRVPRAGRFSVWALLKNAENAFTGQARIDDGTAAQFTGTAGDWAWIRIVESTDLAAGAHTLEVIPGIAFILMDQFVVTDGDSPKPGPWRLDPVPPAAPSSLHASALDEYSLRLTWQLPQPADVHHVNLYRAKGSTCEVTQENLVASPPTDVPGYRCWGLEAGTQYTCCVTAVDRAGNESVSSSSATVATHALDRRLFVAPEVSWRTKDGDCPMLEFKVAGATRAVLWTKWQNLAPKRRGTRGRFEVLLDGTSLGSQPIRFGYVCLGHGGPVVGHWLWNHNAPVAENGSRGFAVPPGKHTLTLRAGGSDELELGGIVLTNDFGFMPEDGYTSFLPMRKNE